MSLETQINKIDCSSSGTLGTGLAGCRMDRKRVTAIGLLQKGYKFTNAIDKASMRQLQQDGILVMLQGVVSFEDKTADNTIITRPGSGIKVLAGQNPYEYTVTFDNGINFHKALTSLSSYQAFDIILFDVDNTLFLTTSKSGDTKGFTLGMFQNGKYMGSDGANASSQTVELQMIERAEIDERMSYITSSELDFSYDELTGVNECVVSIDPIIAASTSIVVGVTLSDMTHPVEGLLVGDFTVTRNGAAVVPSAVAYSSTTKKYTLTVTANVAAAVVEVSLDGIILSTSDDLYKSNTDTAIVT